MSVSVFRVCVSEFVFILDFALKFGESGLLENEPTVPAEIRHNTRSGSRGRAVRSEKTLDTEKGRFLTTPLHMSKLAPATSFSTGLGLELRR